MANPESWPWAGLPEPIRFIISGATGSAAFWVLNKAAIVALSPEEVQKTMPSAFTDLIPLITQAFALSYLVSIALQHTLHSTIVYGWKQDYLTGLIATCELRRQGPRCRRWRLALLALALTTIHDMTTRCLLLPRRRRLRRRLRSVRPDQRQPCLLQSHRRPGLVRQ